MIKIHQQRDFLAFVTGLCLMAGVAQAQELKQNPQSSTPESMTLIDRLKEVEQQDDGYSASSSGPAFLPLDYRHPSASPLPREPNTPSETLKSLVKLGCKAIPALLEHLSDDRPTKIVLKHEGDFGGILVRQGDDRGLEPGRSGEKKTSYTVMVGDLCYVALGQIVNRDYDAVSYVPTALIAVTSVPKSRKIREDLIREWGNLTAEKQRDSLAHDLDSNSARVRNGAAVRLAYYYPSALESLAMQQVARPTYSGFSVRHLVRFQLYSAESAEERKALVDRFVAANGAIAREVIRFWLFEDLEIQEAEEQGQGPKYLLRYVPRECLIDVFGLPATVKSQDRPRFKPLDSAVQARFIDALCYDQSERLDRAIRDLLAKTADDYVANSCISHLVGRGYDTEIETYLKRRSARLKETERANPTGWESRMGWTRLHAAVGLGLVEFVERALQANIPVDARTRDGRTALHLAAADGKEAIVEVLLKAKADRAVKDEKGRTPLELAKEKGNVPVIKLLERK